jgi:hypothetical protein
MSQAALKLTGVTKQSVNLPFHSNTQQVDGSPAGRGLALWLRNYLKAKLTSLASVVLTNSSHLYRRILYIFVQTNIQNHFFRYKEKYGLSVKLGEEF